MADTPQATPPEANDDVIIGQVQFRRQPGRKGGMLWVAVLKLAEFIAWISKLDSYRWHGSTKGFRPEVHLQSEQALKNYLSEQRQRVSNKATQLLHSQAACSFGAHGMSNKRKHIATSSRGQSGQAQEPAETGNTQPPIAPTAEPPAKKSRRKKLAHEKAASCQCAARFSIVASVQSYDEGDPDVKVSWSCHNHTGHGTDAASPTHQMAPRLSREAKACVRAHLDMFPSMSARDIVKGGWDASHLHLHAKHHLQLHGHRCFLLPFGLQLFKSLC